MTTTSPGRATDSAAATSSINAPASTSMRWIAGSPTRNRWAVPAATATLTPSRQLGAGGGPHHADTRHHVLEGEGATRRARAGIATQPARDGVATEVEHRSVPAVQLADQLAEDPLERRGEQLGAALLTQLRDEGLGHGGEAGDVGEQGGAGHRPVDGLAPREGATPILGEVGRGVVREHGARSAVSAGGGGHRTDTCTLRLPITRPAVSRTSTCNRWSVPARHEARAPTTGTVNRPLSAS